jgi:hypothetical protein
MENECSAAYSLWSQIHDAIVEDCNRKGQPAPGFYESMNVETMIGRLFDGHHVHYAHIFNAMNQNKLDFYTYDSLLPPGLWLHYEMTPIASPAQWKQSTAVAFVGQKADVCFVNVKQPCFKHRACHADPSGVVENESFAAMRRIAQFQQSSFKQLIPT